MGVLKAEPAKVQDWATRSVGAYWRAYDVQLAIYALLLAGLGLAMSYSSTVVTGVNPLDPSSNFLRGLVWTAIAVVVFIAATFFDYKWLKTFTWPIYFVNLGLLALSLVIGTGVGGIGPLDRDRTAPVPVQRARQDPDDHRPGQLPGRAPRSPRLDPGDPRAPAS